MFKNKNTLLLDCAIKYLPDEVVRYHIFQKFLKNDKKKRYVTLKFKDSLIPNKLSLLKEKSLFRNRLYAMKNCNRYLLIYLLSMLLGAAFAFFHVGRKTLASLNFKSDQVFFNEFLKDKLMGVQIGDCILSWVLRIDGSKGYLVRDIHFYNILARFIYYFYTQAFFAKCLATLYTGNKYFYAHETTYLDEAIRRVLLRYGFREIRYDFFQHKVIVMPVLKGYEIRKGAYERLCLDEQNFDLEKAENKLRRLVYREETYDYMQGADVNKNINLDISILGNLNNQKVAVIYLHAVSDAQYLYGVDCFIDLHDWLIETLKILDKLNVYVCIKMHPSYYSLMHNYPVDKKYLLVLESIFGVLLDKINVEKPTLTNKKNVCLLHYSVSSVELSRVFPNFLCITHHGTIATEAAYLGHKVICSDASPYIKGKDTFVLSYRSLAEYEHLIGECVSDCTIQKPSERRSLLSYVYTNYLYSKPENIVQTVASSINMKVITDGDLVKLINRLNYISEKDAMFLNIESAVMNYV